MRRLGSVCWGFLSLCFVWQVCFVTCNEWNYWEKCMEHDSQPVDPERSEDFVRVNTKVGPPSLLVP